MTNEKRRARLLQVFRLLLLACGIVVVAQAGWHVFSRAFELHWLALAALAIACTWLPTSQIPGDKGVVTASDTIICLTLLLGGADAALLVAAVATASESMRFTKRWLNFATNIALICCSFFLSNTLVAHLFGNLCALANHKETFFIYALALAVFAIAQNLINHGLVVLMVCLKSGKPMLRTWRANYSWMLVSYFSAVITAAVVNALVHYFGFLAVGFIVPVLLANYLTYRPYIQNIEAARQHVAEMRALHLRTLEAFATAVDAKDQITHAHVRRVQIYAEGVARLMGLGEKEIEALHAGALLHDIGKIAVPDYILNKPGKLTAAEFDKMKLHTIVGAQILERIKFPYPLVPIVRHHHERWDGTGYPDGLQGAEIPLTARILTVVDCFDAVREDRQYRKGMTREEAIALLLRDKSKYYDPAVVDLFIAHLAEFEAQITELQAGAQTFTPVQIEETEAIRRAAPAAGLAEENRHDQPAEYLQTILAAHQSSQEYVALAELAQLLHNTHERRAALALVTGRLEQLVPYETCVIYLFDEAGSAAVAQHVAGLNAESFRGRAVRPGEGVTGWVLANNQPFANTDPALDLTALGAVAQGYRTLAVCPLTKDGRRFGALALYAQTHAQYTDEQLRLLAQVAALTTDALDHAAQHEQAAPDELLDGLTGLPNARHFYALFAREQARVATDEHPLALVKLDVDDFRQLNETHGRAVGDRLLRELAVVVRAQLRREDMLVRYTGDKFFVLLRNTPPEIISEIVVRIQTVVALHRFTIDDNETLTLGLSIGQARLAHDGATLEDLLEAAERRLRADKAARTALRLFAGTHKEPALAQPQPLGRT